MRKGICRSGRDHSGRETKGMSFVMKDCAGNFTPLAVSLVIIMLLLTLSVTKFIAAAYPVRHEIHGALDHRIRSEGCL